MQFQNFNRKNLEKKPHIAPQAENERLSLRTIDGMRKASKLGKWQGTAPYGYFNNKAQKKEDKSTGRLIADIWRYFP